MVEVLHGKSSWESGCFVKDDACWLALCGLPAVATLRLDRVHGSCGARRSRTRWIACLHWRVGGQALCTQLCVSFCRVCLCFLWVLGGGASHPHVRPMPTLCPQSLGACKCKEALQGFDEKDADSASAAGTDAGPALDAPAFELDPEGTS